MPCIKAVAFVTATVALLIFPATGPAIFVHWYAAMVPSGSVPLPFKLVVFVGRVIFASKPALAVGAWLPGVFTVTTTVSLPIAPRLSTTVSWYS